MRSPILVCTLVSGGLRAPGLLTFSRSFCICAPCSQVGTALRSDGCRMYVYHVGHLLFASASSDYSS